jgi:hypothetical protein
MKQELFDQINEAKHEIRNNEILIGIVERARNKFFAKSASEITLYDLKDYVISQLEWKKQSVYKNLLPTLLECCEVMGEEFEMLFNENPQNWRDANKEIY